MYVLLCKYYPLYIEVYTCHVHVRTCILSMYHANDVITVLLRSCARARAAQRNCALHACTCAYYVRGRSTSAVDKRKRGRVRFCLAGVSLSSSEQCQMSEKIWERRKGRVKHRMKPTRKLEVQCTTAGTPLLTTCIYIDKSVYTSCVLLWC